MFSKVYTLVLMLLIAGSSWIMFGPLSILVCIIVFGFALAFYVRSWIGLLIIVACLFLLVLLLLPVVSSCRGAFQRMMCTNNIKQIVLALHNYDQKYGCLPPAYVPDKNGKPMHSWRILILPFLELSDLYKEYDFNEPWDGPNNKKLLDKRPQVFACPCDEKAMEYDTSITNYAAIIGPNAAWDLEKPRSLGDKSFYEKAAETILLAETTNQDIRWTEPRDIFFETVQSNENTAALPTVTSKHGCYRRDFFYDYESDAPSSVNVAFVDGHVRCLAMPIPNDKRKEIFQIGGTTDGKLDYSPAEVEEHIVVKIRWKNWIAFGVWIVSVLLLLVHAIRPTPVESCERNMPPHL